MKKYVINTCFGGFGLSPEAIEMMGASYDEMDWGDKMGFRSHPKLVEVVEALGEKANGRFASLKIVEVPARVVVWLQDYDGREHLAEEHRTWY